MKTAIITLALITIFAHPISCDKVFGKKVCRVNNKIIHNMQGPIKGPATSEA